MIFFRKILAFLKQIFKNKEKLILFFLVLVIFSILISFLVVSNTHSNNSNTVDNFGIIIPNPTTPIIPINTSTPKSYIAFIKPFPGSRNILETSYISDDQQKVWSFIKNNFQTKDRGDSLAFIVKNSELMMNISGFAIQTVDTGNFQQAGEVIKKIESFITTLNYQPIQSGFKNNLFEIVNRESFDRGFLIKDNQVFSIFLSSRCDTDEQCPIIVNYYNNIQNQINSQLNLINKFSANPNNDTDLVSLLESSQYITNAIKINQYIIFTTISFGYDTNTYLAKEENGQLVSLLSYGGLEDFELPKSEENLDQIWCALKSFGVFYFNSRSDSDYDADIIKRCSQYMKPFNPYTGEYL